MTRSPSGATILHVSHEREVRDQLRQHAERLHAELEQHERGSERLDAILDRLAVLYEPVKQPDGQSAEATGSQEAVS